MTATRNLVAGFGCRKGIGADALHRALLQALEASAKAAKDLSAVAAPQFKDGEAGLHELASELRLPLILVDRSTLEAAQSACLTHSSHAEQETGLASVAEAAALAATGPGARLLGPRVALDGATCALARKAAP